MKSTTPTQKKALTLLIAVAVALSATAGFAGAATTTDLTVSITDDDDTIEPGETTTVEIAVANADGGVGAASYGIELTDPSVAEITDAEITGSPTQPAIQENGSSADVRYFQADTDNSGEVVILTVTLEATASGSTSLNIVENSEFGNVVVFDEGGASYDFNNVGSATLTVNTPPDADAGANQTVDENATVTLDGSASDDPDGDSLSYQWTETSDSGVSLSDADTATPTFTAPDVSEDTTLDFEVEVTDTAGATDTDSVSVTVQPTEPDPADFQVSNLNAPESATQGDTIDVSADVENTGEEAATKTVAFRLDTNGDGSITDEANVETQNVQLDAGASTTVEFTGIDTSNLAPGDYTHGVATPDDTATAQITINEPAAPANFQVSSLDAPATTTQGDNITVSANVTNDGGEEATQSVAFGLDADDDGTLEELASQDVTLASGETQPVTFDDIDTSGLDAGDYTHGVVTENDSATATITVEAPEPANFQVLNLDAPESATQGDNITVSANVTNDGDGEATQTVEFRLDGDSDGTLDGDLALASQEVTLDGGETQTVTFSDLDTSGLLAGDYVHGVVTENDSATATITIDESESLASETAVSLSPESSEVLAGDNETYDVVVDNADGGVGAYELTVALDNATVASITDVTVAGNPGLTDVSYAGDNSSVTISAALANTDDTGAVSVASIAVEGTAEGSSDLSVDAQALGNENGDSYTVTDENGASISVVDIPPVGDYPDPPTDPDDDGRYEDVNGDGEFDIVDVQALFANLDDETIENYPDAFDFNADGTVDVVDVQKLFTEAS